MSAVLWKLPYVASSLSNPAAWATSQEPAVSQPAVLVLVCAPKKASAPGVSMSLSSSVVLRFVSTCSFSLLLVGCSGLGGSSSSSSPTPTASPQADIHSINHIIFMLQENRSFDHYF